MSTAEAIMALHELARAYEDSAKQILAVATTSYYGQDDVALGAADAATAASLRAMADDLARRAKTRAAMGRVLR